MKNRYSQINMKYHKHQGCQLIQEEQCQSHSKWVSNQHINEQQTNLRMLRCLKHNTQSQMGRSKIVFVCLNEQCYKTSQHTNRQNSSLMQQYPNNSPIFCEQCINQQAHLGHIFCTTQKLQQLVLQHKKNSIQYIKSIRESIQVLKAYFNQQIDNFLLKTQECLFIKEQIQDITKLPNNIIQICQQMLLSMNKQQSVNFLQSQSQYVNEQIQMIHSNIAQCFKQAQSNIQFIVKSKHLQFNPDDMQTDKIGLTLNRNQIQFVNEQPLMGQDSNLLQCRLSHMSHNSQSCVPKMVFTQLPLLSQHSRGFQIVKLAGLIAVGVLSHHDHQQIKQKMQYQAKNQQFYGIQICNNGCIVVNNKGKIEQKSTPIIKQNDIIQFTYHCKQNALTIMKYSKNQYQTNKTNKQQIVTIFIKQNCQQYLYLFASISVDGDSVRLVDLQQHEQVSEVDVRQFKQGQSHEDKVSEVDFKTAPISSYQSSKVVNFKEKQKRQRCWNTKP